MDGARIPQRKKKTSLTWSSIKQEKKPKRLHSIGQGWQPQATRATLTPTRCHPRTAPPGRGPPRSSRSSGTPRPPLEKRVVLLMLSWNWANAQTGLASALAPATDWVSRSLGPDRMIACTVPACTACGCSINQTRDDHGGKSHRAPTVQLSHGPPFAPVTRAKKGKQWPSVVEFGDCFFPFFPPFLGYDLSLLQAYGWIKVARFKGRDWNLHHWDIAPCCPFALPIFEPQ